MCRVVFFLEYNITFIVQSFLSSNKNITIGNITIAC